MVLLYHYTDRAGKDGIYADELIRATDAHDGLDLVVRFTELSHDTDKRRLISNNWGSNPPPNAQDKLRFWFKFDSAELPPTTCKVDKRDDRNIWVCYEDVPLKATTQPPPGHTSATQTGKTFYYYTGENERDIIYKNGYISPKAKWNPMHQVVRLTDVKPTTPKSDIVWHVFGEKYSNPELEAKTKYWFKFDESEVRDLTRVRKQNGRRVWETPIAVYTKMKKPNAPSSTHHDVGGSSRSKDRHPPANKRKHDSTTHSSQRDERSYSQGSPTAPANQPSTALYYYTDRAGKDAIFNAGRIEAQRGCLTLTELSPSSLGGTAQAQLSGVAVMDFWFEFKSTNLDGLTQTVDAQGGILWTVDRDIELSRSSSQGRLST